MDRLSDCILLSIFYRCPIATFLNGRLRSKSYSMRRWVYSKRFGSHLDKYTSLCDLSISRVEDEKEMLTVNPSILTQLTAIHIDYVECEEVKIAESCPNLTSLSVKNVDSVSYLSIPKTVMRLMLSNNIYESSLDAWADIACRIPSLIESNIPTKNIAPEAEEWTYFHSEDVNINVSSATLKRLIVLDTKANIVTATLTQQSITILCPHLTSLDLNTTVADKSIRDIASTCPNLLSLALRSFFCGDLSVLKQMKKLQSLRMDRQSIQLVDARKLPPTVTYLNLIRSICQIEEPSSLPLLLVLKCRRIRGALPTTLRVDDTE